MSLSDFNPWPMTGAARWVLRILTALVILFYFVAYPFGVSDFWKYCHLGRVGIQYDRMPDQTTAVIGVVSGGPADLAGIKTGDRIIQVDDWIVTSETTLDEVANHVSGAAGGSVTLKLRTADNQERSVNLTRINLPVDVFNAWSTVAQMVVFAVCGLIIFWTRRRSGYALFVSLGLIIFGVNISGVWIYEAGPGMLLFYGLGFILMLFVLLTYPNGKFRPLWTLGIGVIGVILYGLTLFPPPLEPFEWPWQYILLAQVILFGSALGCQIFNYYRKATPDEKFRMRPAFWGAVSALSALFLFTILYNLPGVYVWLYTHAYIQMAVYFVNALGFVLLPIFLTISMVKNGQAAKGEPSVELPAA